MFMRPCVRLRSMRHGSTMRRIKRERWEAQGAGGLCRNQSNPLEIPVEEIRNIQVLETWKEGTCMYKRQVQESQNI